MLARLATHVRRVVAPDYPGHGFTPPPVRKLTPDALLEAMTILSLGAEEAQVAADLRRKLEEQGEQIGMADYMIAAVCMVNGGILLTRNRKHFDRVPDLKLSLLAT